MKWRPFAVPPMPADLHNDAFATREKTGCFFKKKRTNPLLFCFYFLTLPLTLSVAMAVSVPVVCSICTGTCRNPACVTAGNSNV